MNQTDAAYWIRHLKLMPHPEGGHYRETMRSAIQVSTEKLAMLKPAITSIYYLLAEKEYSAFHRLSSDEIWYFHTGTALTIHYFDPAKKRHSIVLSDSPDGRLSLCVPAGCWFAAEIESKGFALVSCAVAPGFLFSEFEIGKRDELLVLFPGERDLVRRLSKS